MGQQMSMEEIQAITEMLHLCVFVLRHSLSYTSCVCSCALPIQEIAAGGHRQDAVLLGLLGHMSAPHINKIKCLAFHLMPTFTEHKYEPSV